MKPLRVTIQIKAFEQHFQVVLFIMFYKVFLTVKTLNQTLVCTQMKVIECDIFVQ